jgi:hypothetical protein
MLFRFYVVSLFGLPWHFVYRYSYRTCAGSWCSLLFELRFLYIMVSCPSAVRNTTVTNYCYLFTRRLSAARARYTFELLDPLIEHAAPKGALLISLVQQPIGSGMDQSGFIMLAVNTVDRQGQMLLQDVVLCFHPGRFALVGLCNHAQQYELYCMVAPSKHEIDLLKQREKIASSYIAMLIPSQGNAKLTVAHVPLDDEAIQDIFHGGGGGELVKDASHIACQVLHSVQQVVFCRPNELQLPAGLKDCSVVAPPATTRKSENGGALPAKAVAGITDTSHLHVAAPSRNNIPDSDRRNTNKQEFPVVEKATRPLILDLPVGVRILNACRQGSTKDKVLKIKLSPEEGEAEHTARKSMAKAEQNIPGSAQWIKARQLQRLQEAQQQERYREGDTSAQEALLDDNPNVKDTADDEEGAYIYICIPRVVLCSQYITPLVDILSCFMIN